MKEVLHKWIDQYLSSEETVLLLVLLIVAALLVGTLGSILAPVFAALILAFLLQGVINWLARRGLSSGLAFTLTYLLFAIAFLSFIVGVIPAVARQIPALLSDLPKMVSSLRDLLVSLPDKYGDYISPEQYQALLNKASTDLGRLAEQALTFSISSFPSVLALLVYMVLIPLLVFFMLKDKDQLLSFFSGLLPEKRQVMRAVWVEMDEQIANYMRGKAIEIVIVGGVSYIAFLVLGLNYAALLALLVGLSVLIPYIGATVVTLPVLLVGYFQWGIGPEFFWLFGVYGVIQFLDGNVLVPVLFSEVVNLHPVSIIVAVLVFGGIWGFWGVFFAIPLATLVKALYNAWPRGEVAGSGDITQIDEPDSVASEYPSEIEEINK